MKTGTNVWDGDFGMRITFNQIVDALESLDQQQKQLLLRILSETNESQNPAPATLTNLDEIRSSRFYAGLKCPYCGGSENIKKNGKTKRGQQRYFHHDCNRSFSDLTFTPIYRTKYPQKWAMYLQAMEQGLPIRKCAFLVGISVPTAFHWRHKILHALSEMKSQKLKGIVEADETFFLHSEKGKRNLQRKARKRGGVASKRGISKEQVCVLVARDRTKQTIAEVAKFGQLSAAALDRLLAQRLESGAILCTDEEKTFRKFASDHKLQHEQVCPKKKRYVTKEIYHIQNVNAYHERLKTFIDRFRGVATKYLNHYIAYHLFLDSTRSVDELTRTRELFLQALRQPMRTTGKDLSQYCEARMVKLAS